MSNSHSENTVGPWAKQKLDALEAYLEAYMRVMKNQQFDLTYIDGFAGAGVSKIRSAWAGDDEAFSLIEDFEAQEEEEFISGSPLRALGLDRPFDHYFFFDADPRRVQLLDSLQEVFPTCDLRVRVGDANASVQGLVDHFRPWNRRGMAFLDPYGAHLHWETISAVARTGKVDVIINFPLGMAINRLIKRDGQIRQSWVDQLDQCFGTHEWYDLAFEQEQPDLFGSSDMKKRSDTALRLLELYTSRLKKEFKSVATPSLVKNTRGSPLYYLIWAGHPTGLKIAEHILNLGDTISTKRKTRC